jgi:hypothetical protein
VARGQRAQLPFDLRGQLRLVAKALARELFVAAAHVTLGLRVQLGGGLLVRR